MPVCPNCYSRALIKFGKYRDSQKWRCEFCWRTTIHPRLRIPKGLVVEPCSKEKDTRDSISILESRTHYNDWYYDEATGAFLSNTMKQLVESKGIPDYWVVPDPILVRCSFFVGYWCGKDGDLICVAPLPFVETEKLDPHLSPAGRTPVDAIKKTIMAKRG